MQAIGERLPRVLGNKKTKKKYRTEQGNMNPFLGRNRKQSNVDVDGRRSSFITDGVRANPLQSWYFNPLQSWYFNPLQSLCVF